MREGVDIIGLDLWRTQTVNPSDCRSKCESALVCRSYTFNTRTNTCYIKENAISAYRHTHAISGYEAAQAETIKELPFDVHEGVDYPGGDYASLANTNFRKCLNACESQPWKCSAFAYVQSLKKCWLKRGVSLSVAKKGVTTGIRARTNNTFQELDLMMNGRTPEEGQKIKEVREKERETEQKLEDAKKKIDQLLKDAAEGAAAEPTWLRRLEQMTNLPPTSNKAKSKKRYNFALPSEADDGCDEDCQHYNCDAPGATCE